MVETADKVKFDAFFRSLEDAERAMFLEAVRDRYYDEQPVGIEHPVSFLDILEEVWEEWKQIHRDGSGQRLTSLKQMNIWGVMSDESRCGLEHAYLMLHDR